MAIYTRFASIVTIVAVPYPGEVTIQYRNGDQRTVYLSEIRADGGRPEIAAAIALLHTLQPQEDPQEQH